MRNTFTREMLNVGQRDEKLVVLVSDISHFALQPFAKACPNRFYNLGICEQSILSIAAGLSHSGFHPVVHTITPFLIERSFEQIKLDFCYQELGGNLVSVGSAFDYSGLGVSHYCYNDIAMIKTLPDTQIICPAMPDEFTVLFNATYLNDQLTYFRLPGKKHDYQIPTESIKFGKAVKVADGQDVTIVAVGPQLKTVLNSANLLHSIGVKPDIIYIHTVKPFDCKTITDSVQKTGNILVLEEHSIFGGTYDDVLRCVNNLGNISTDQIAIPNFFVHGYGTVEDHYEFLGFTPANIQKRVRRLLGMN